MGTNGGAGEHTNRRSFYLGEWYVDPVQDRILRGDEVTDLRLRVMQVLVYMAYRKQEVVSADELIQHVWAPAVVSDHSVKSVVSELRHVLGDDARHPQYIETIPKRGYRMIAPVGKSAEELRSEFDSAASFDSEHPERVVAVLPLENLSGDPGQEYVADGMTDEIIGELAKLSSVRIISRTSVMHYKGTRPLLSDVAAELGADLVLEGSVTCEADLTRVSVQLIDATKDDHLWSDRFDQRGSSVLALRTDIARSVAGALRLQLTGDEERALALQRCVNEAAYDTYLRALHRKGNYSYTVEWAPAVLEGLESSVALDPDFAEAWAQLANVRMKAATWGRADLYVKAREAAKRALSLDSRLVLAHYTLGFIAWFYDWDFEAAAGSFARAMQLGPYNPDAIEGHIASLTWQERFDEQVPLIERMGIIAPRDQQSREWQIKNFTYARFYERAVAEVPRLHALIPGYVQQDERLLYRQLGRFEDAHHAEMSYFGGLGTAFHDGLREAGKSGWAKTGYEGSRRSILAYRLAAEEPDPYEIVMGYAFLGELDPAFEWLDRAVAARSQYLALLVHMTSGFWWDPLRPDPRFDEAMMALGLVAPKPAHPARTADVARIMAFRGRAAEAADQLQGAMTSSPHNVRMPRWLESMGWAHFALGDYEETISWTRRVSGYDISSQSLAFAHLLLASSHANQSRAGEARKALSKATRLWPRLEIDRDLKPLFIGGDGSMRDRYITGLQIAGLD